MSKLFLIPNFIQEVGSRTVAFDAQQISFLRIFFVEEPKAARALLKTIVPELPLRECQFHELNEHSTLTCINEYGQMIKTQDAGVISESGCPCVADPGADLVLLAHQYGVEVIPLVGPSSILLALMASGLNGQNFAFNGYLPREVVPRKQKIKMLEHRAIKEKQTQIFMETPYRNMALWEELLITLEPSTHLCIAVDIHGNQQIIKSRTVQEWQKNNLQLLKKPALFIINRC